MNLIAMKTILKQVIYNEKRTVTTELKIGMWNVRGTDRGVS